MQLTYCSLLQGCTRGTHAQVDKFRIPQRCLGNLQLDERRDICPNYYQRGSHASLSGMRKCSFDIRLGAVIGPIGIVPQAGTHQIDPVITEQLKGVLSLAVFEVDRATVIHLVDVG